MKFRQPVKRENDNTMNMKFGKLSRENDDIQCFLVDGGISEKSSNETQKQKCSQLTYWNDVELETNETRNTVKHNQ
jgi:hypothetical protein